MAAKLPKEPKRSLKGLVPGLAMKAKLRTPATAIRVLDGSNPSSPLTIPAGATVVQFSPRTSSITVQVAFQQGESNTVGRFFSLLLGQGYEMRTNTGEEFSELQVEFYAATAVIVDVVVF